MRIKLVATGAILAMLLAGPAFAQHSSPNARSFQQALDESALAATQQQTLRVAALAMREAASRAAGGGAEAGEALGQTAPLLGHR